MNMRSTIGHGVTVAFDEKPGEPVRNALKAHGFRWNPASRTWYRRRVTGAADALDALRNLVNPPDPNAPDGNCWNCGAPGRFRPRAAACPVLCDRCHEARERADRGERLQRRVMEELAGYGYGRSFENLPAEMREFILAEMERYPRQNPETTGHSIALAVLDEFETAADGVMRSL